MKIQIPTECPSCSSVLTVTNGQLFCKNSSCSAKSSKIVEGFCKKLKIKGFGAKTIEKLNLITIPDIYNLTEQRLIQELGEKTGTKLFTEIQLSKKVDFGTLLGSLGIPLIGGVAANKVGNKINSFNELNPTSVKAAGLGDKAAQHLIEWINSVEGMDTIEVLTRDITFSEKPKQAAVDTVAYRFDVCITGKLDDFTNRTKAAEFLSQYGIEVKNSVTKSVKYLICEDNTKVGSSSYKKAQSAGIQITSIKELLEIIGE